MTSQQMLQTDLLEILFENRNKQYGAYQLRKTYPKRLTKAVVIALSSVFLLLLCFPPSISGTATAVDKRHVVVVEQVVPLQEQKKTEPPKNLKSPGVEQVKQQLFTTRIAITEKEISNPVPPQDLFDRAAVSTITTGGADASLFSLPVSAEKTIDSGSVTGMEPEKEEVIPDRQPHFPGGIQAWMAFLNQHLQAPQPLETGEKRTVVIRFYVAEDGRVTNFQVLQSDGTSFDNEVIRVLKKMPRWIPATKAGQAVPVSFTQRVTFVGMEE